MARPVIAKRQAEIALKTRRRRSLHGCTGKGNDQVRFELAYKAIAAKRPNHRAWREWDIDSREDAIAYAEKHNVPIEQSKRTFTAATATSGTSATKAANSKILPTPPAKLLGSGLFLRKKSDKAEEVEIGFESGTPVSVEWHETRSGRIAQYAQ